MSENWTSRHLLSNLSVALVIILAILIIFFNEWRIRSYVGEPWKEERPAILETLNGIDQRVHKGSEERKQVFEKLQAIDSRVEQFEKKVIIILREDGSQRELEK